MLLCSLQPFGAELYVFFRRPPRQMSSMSLGFDCPYCAKHFVVAITMNSGPLPGAEMPAPAPAPAPIHVGIERSETSLAEDLELEFESQDLVGEWPEVPPPETVPPGRAWRIAEMARAAQHLQRSPVPPAPKASFMPQDVQVKARPPKALAKKQIRAPDPGPAVAEPQPHRIQGLHADSDGDKKSDDECGPQHFEHTGKEMQKGGAAEVIAPWRRRAAPPEWVSGEQAALAKKPPLPPPPPCPPQKVGATFAGADSSTYDYDEDDWGTWRSSGKAWL